MVDIEDLKSKYVVFPMPPYGDCLVIDMNKFNPDWEGELAAKGYSCFKDVMDNYPVFFVPLNKMPYVGSKLVEDLMIKHGGVSHVSPWGQCVAVPKDAFSWELEQKLGDEGFRCHYGSSGGQAVVFVQLKKSTAQSKVVYVPPPKPTVTPPPAPAAVQAEPPLSEVPKVAVRGVDWTAKDEAALLIEFDRLNAQGKGRNCQAVLAGLPRFKGRSVTSIEVKLKRLRKMRRDGTLSAAVQEILSHGNVEVKKLEKKDETKQKSKDDAASRWTLDDELALYSLLHDVHYGRNRVLAKAIKSGQLKFLGRNAEACLQHFGKISKDPEFLRKWQEFSKGAAVAETAHIDSTAGQVPQESPSHVSKTEVELKIPEELTQLLELLKQFEGLPDKVDLLSSELAAARLEFAVLRRDFEAHGHLLGSGAVAYSAGAKGGSS